MKTKRASAKLSFVSVTLIVVALCLQASVVSAAPEVAYMTTEKPREFVDKEERISGGPVSGLVFENASSSNSETIPRELEALYAFVEGGVGSINVSLTTIDGRYIYSSVNEVVSGNNRWVQIELKPAKAAFLNRNNYKTDEISVLVTPAGGHTQSPKIYPSRWGDYTTTENVRIFFKAEGYRVLLQNGHCDESTSERHAFKFDHICTSPTKKNIYLRTRRGGDISKPIKLELTLPDGA